MHAATAKLIIANGSLRTADIPQRAEAARAAGFDGIGIHARDYGRLRAEGWSDAALRSLLADHGLDLVEIETAVGWDDPPGQRDADSVRREEWAFGLADAVGARHLTAVGALNGSLRDSATDGFAGLCDRAAEHGLLVALEPQACSTIADLDTAVAIVRAAGRRNGGLNLDAWHRTRGGWPLASLAALAPEEIVVVQLDDGPLAPITDDYLEECTRYRTAPGEGEFDLTGFVQAVYRSGTDAPVSIEVLSDEFDRLPPAEVAQRLADATRSVLAAARTGS